jgi:hypothetical protein
MLGPHRHQLQDCSEQAPGGRSAAEVRGGEGDRFRSAEVTTLDGVENCFLRDAGVLDQDVDRIEGHGTNEVKHRQMLPGSSVVATGEELDHFFTGQGFCVRQVEVAVFRPCGGGEPGGDQGASIVDLLLPPERFLDSSLVDLVQESEQDGGRRMHRVERCQGLDAPAQVWRRQ